MGQAIFRPFRSSPAERSDRAAGDRMRHRAKVRKSIQDNIQDIISEESIIGKDRDRIIKVPIRGVKEYRFVYGDNVPGTAQGKGDGSTRPGQVVGKREAEGKDGSDKAGDKPGVDYYETDITLDELIDIMFEDLQLPDLERKRLKFIEQERQIKRKGYRKKGIFVRLDKRKTQRKRIRREIAEGLKNYPETALSEEIAEYPEHIRRHYQLDAADGLYHKRFRFHEDDKTYKHTVPDIKQESNAVVLCIMDTSGSMDIMKKYLARSFFFILYQFIRSKYQNVEIVFIAHHTEAREVTEEEFFHKGESGGTFISSGYRKALEIVEERYSPALWNIYAFHCSDGDNWDSDNPAAVTALKELVAISNLVGYGEIKPLDNRSYEGSMLNHYKKHFGEEPSFHAVVIKKKEDVWKSFKEFIKHEKGGEE